MERKYPQDTLNILFLGLFVKNIMAAASIFCSKNKQIAEIDQHVSGKMIENSGYDSRYPFN